MDQFEQTTSEKKAAKSKLFMWIGILLVVLVVAGGTYWFLVKNDYVTEENANDQVADAEEEAAKAKDPSQYNWSTMDQGPYKDSIGYAMGANPTTWFDSKIILAEHASVPDAILKNGVIHVYFVDVSEDGKPEQIGHIQSSDNGKTWSKKTILTISGLGDKVAVDPNPYLLPDGKIRLYYFDISKTRTEGTENNSIYSAISADGINFTEEEGVRFKYKGIYDPSVIKVGDAWRLYVGTDENNVLSATSADGLNFVYEGVALSGGSIPKVIYTDDLYYLYTGGIQISTSSDGKIFKKTMDRFDIGGLTADPGVIKLADGTYFMVYKTKIDKAQP